jgi:DNA invertase Pin-like site-specific DNA recombinase
VPPSATTLVRVVTYARVSTKMQADRGKSLDDQEARFTAFIERTGAIRVQAYAEARSAGTVLQRKTFLRMFEELPSLNVDALVIDSLDRFTRDKFLGAEQFGKLREMDVKLWELEFEEDRPLDLTRDADRDYIWQKFSDAEAERRRIKKRQKSAMRSSGTEARRRRTGLASDCCSPGRRVISTWSPTRPPRRSCKRWTAVSWPVNHSARSSSGCSQLRRSRGLRAVASPWRC